MDDLIEWWTVGMVSNAVIALAYFLIFGAILLPLIRERQVRRNPLGTATAAIFLTCAVHHGVHALHMLMPTFDVDLVQGLAMRTAWGWQLALWDVVGAVVGVYYWSLRRTYGALMDGSQLFQDMRKREEQALEINDTILQGMVVARHGPRPRPARARRGGPRQHDRLGQPARHRPAGRRGSGRVADDEARRCRRPSPARPGGGART